MAQSPRYHGAVVCVETRNNCLKDLRQQISQVFDKYEQGPDRSGTDSQVVGRSFTARITLDDPLQRPDYERRVAQLDQAANLNQSQRNHAANAEFRVQITLFAHTPVSAGVDARAQTILADILLRALAIYQGDFVEWMSKHVILSAEELRACPKALPPRDKAQPLAAGVRRFPPVDDAYVEIAYRTGQSAEGVDLGPLETAFAALNAEERLVHAFRTDPPQDYIDRMDDKPSDVMRLGVWAMTGTLAFVCLPVAVSISLLNLIKGEDFRLNTQALSVGGLLVVLQANGSIANAAQLIPLIG